MGFEDLSDDAFESPVRAAAIFALFDFFFFFVGSEEGSRDSAGLLGGESSGSDSSSLAAFGSRLATGCDSAMVRE